jgi:hypothetical protein
LLGSRTATTSGGGDDDSDSESDEDGHAAMRSPGWVVRLVTQAVTQLTSKVLAQGRR